MTGRRTTPPPGELWAPFVDGLPVDGASITVITRTGLSSTVSTSDEVAARLDGLQLELGEGPRWQAFRTGVPVLVPDTLQPGAHDAWPLFGVRLPPLGVGAVFAIPLVLGVLVVGIADLWSPAATGPWSETQLAEALGIAAAAAGPSVELATRSASSPRPVSPSTSAELRREVHQATGMLVVQLDVRPPEALLRLEAHAFATGRPVLDVARDVIARRLDLSAQE